MHGSLGFGIWVYGGRWNPNFAPTLQTRLRDSIKIIARQPDHVVLMCIDLGVASLC